jgi:L-asparaginase
MENRSGMRIKIFAAGGTIDKVYFDQKSTYQVGESRVEEILREANADIEYEFESILKKDSLDMTDEDRRLIFDKIKAASHELVIVPMEPTPWTSLPENCSPSWTR